MKTIHYLLLFSLWGIVILFQRCQPKTESVTPKSATSKSKANAREITGFYVTLENMGYQATTSNTSFTYWVEHMYSGEGDIIDEWVIGLGPALSFSNVISAKIDGVPYTNISNTQKAGAPCTVTGNMLVFKNLPREFSVDRHVVEFTVNRTVHPGIVPTTLTFTNTPDCEVATVDGPGGFSFIGKITQETTNKTTTKTTYVCANDPKSTTTTVTTAVNSSTAVTTGMSVSLVSGGKVVQSAITDGLGYYRFANLVTGTYTVKLPTLTAGTNQTVTVTPGTSQTVAVNGYTPVNPNFKITTITSQTVTAGPYPIDCVPPGPVTCAYSANYWFANNKAVWPTTTVSVANYSYSKREGQAIYNARSGKNANAPLANAFSQVAAVKLSFNGQTPPYELQLQVNTIEKFLQPLGKLDPGSPQFKTTVVPAVVVDAYKAIATWICQHPCNTTADPNVCAAL